MLCSMAIISDQIALDTATPKAREDWLIPVRARMIAELGRMGLSEINPQSRPNLSIPELVEHLVAVGLGTTGTQFVSPDSGEQEPQS